MVGDVKQLKPTALTGPGGTGKTIIELAALHHEQIKQKFLDQRRSIHCDEFTTSLEYFLGRLSSVLGAGLEVVIRSSPPKKLIKDLPGPTILVLNNVETIFDSLWFTDELWSRDEHCWWEIINKRPDVGEMLCCLRRAAPAWNAR